VSASNGEKKDTPAQDLNEAESIRNKKLAQAFRLVVGECECTGDIIYSFEGFRNTGTREEYRKGGKNPQREISRCYCDVCGRPYDCNNAEYAKIIQKYRDAL